jgi:spermidine synthase
MFQGMQEYGRRVADTRAFYKNKRFFTSFEGYLPPMNSSGRGKPVFFIPVILLSGIAMGIGFPVWFRMYTTLFGIHQFSVASIMGTMMICLSVGSRTGGRLADRMRDKPVLFIVLQTIIGIFSLFNPFFFGVLQNLLGRIILELNPGSFSMGFIRIALTLFFLILPIASMGAIFPVICRFFTHSTSSTGNRNSLVLSVISAGVAAGIMLDGFLLIPGSGMNYSLQVASLISFIISLSALGFIFLRRVRKTVIPTPVAAKKRKQSTMLFKKNKAVLEIGAKLTRAMVRVHVVNGFAASSILIIAIRLMNTYAVTGLAYLNLIVFSIYFAGIALGSAFYRILTTRMANGYLLMASLEFLNGFALLFSFSLLSVNGPAILHVVEPADTWWNTVIYQILPVASLLVFPAFISGLLFSLAGSVYIRRIQHSGRNIGKLGSFYFTGTLAGVVITPFILLPLIGSVYSCFALILISLLCGFYLLLRDSRLIRGFRISYTVITMACASGLLFSLVRSGWINTFLHKNTESVRTMLEGRSARVSLVEKNGGTLSLYIDGIENLASGRDGMFNQQFPAFLSCVLNPHIQSSLVVGFGMGYTASALESCNVPLIHIAEVYPEIMKLSSDAFSDENNDIITSSHVDISLEDARQFLLRNSGQFDLITSGYTGTGNLPGFFTDGFYQKCYTGLTDNGMLAQILPLRGITVGEFGSVVKACSHFFSRVNLWYISRNNVLLVAFKKSSEPDFCSIALGFKNLMKNGEFAINGIPDAESLFARRLMDNVELKKLTGGYTENRDDLPLIEFSRTSRNFKDTVLFHKLIQNLNQGEMNLFAAPCHENTIEAKAAYEQARNAIKQQLISGEEIP